MSKRNLVTRSLAFTAVAGLSTLAFAPAAFATHDATGHADASASTGTGALFELLDTGACEATDTETSEGGTPTGRCGDDNLNFNNQVIAFSQSASAPGDGTTAADASVAPIDIANFNSIDLTGVVSGLQAIDTGTVLDTIINGVDPLTRPLLEALVPTVLTPLDDALQDVLAQVESVVPVRAEIGAISSQCTADGSPSASGSGEVAGVDIIIDLGGATQIRVPMVVDTAPNSRLVASVPRQAVNDVVDGLKATFEASLGGALGPLNDILSTLQDQVLTAVFDGLEPTLLQALDDGLEPLVSGTVNKQESTAPGQIEVTSLDLTLLSAAGATGAQHLQLGRTSCGPNTNGGPHVPTDPTDPTDPGDPGDGGPGDGGPGDGDNVPTAVTSGATGEENVARLALGATGSLLVMAGAGSLMRRRFTELG